jgi:tetratricopeptide (TPR) repeat protein
MPDTPLVDAATPDGHFEEVAKQFLRDRDAGRQPDPQQYLHSFPELASQLREFFADLELFDRLAPDLSPTAASRAPCAAVPAPGDRLGRFEMLEKLGQGGMGVVLRGRDPLLGRELAVKVLNAEWQHDEAVRRRFHEEAVIGGRLQHPGLVPVYELGSDADLPFIAMKLVEGRTLEQLLDERPDPSHDLPRFLTVFEQVCQAVGYAHALGVIHRDLKPGNVMLGAHGEVQVMDWGLAKVVAGPDAEPSREAATFSANGSERNDRLSHSGAVLGTLAFMAPEQARGERCLDARADVFGLGAILCVMLTRQPPFGGTTRDEIKCRAAGAELSDAFVRLDASGADTELIALAKDCLAADPTQRPPDGAAVAARVGAYRAGVAERLRAAELRRAQAETRAVEERKRRRVQLALAGSLLLLLTLGGAGGWWLREQRLEREAELAKQRLEREAELAQQETERVRQEAELKQAVEPDLRVVTEELGKEKPHLADLTKADRLLAGVEGRLAQSGSEELRQRARQARDKLTRARTNQQMAAKLEEARLRGASATKEGFDHEGSRKLFEVAFAWYGLDVRRGPIGEVAARIEASPIREELVIALDWWSLAAPADAERLRAVANRADADAWRRQLREALRRSDDGLIRQLGEDARAADLPPASLVFLAEALRKAKAPERAVALLSAARQRSPADFWVNFELASALTRTSPPQLGEAVCYYTAAQALRPDSVVVLDNLGGVLYDQKKWPQAEAAFREAIRINPGFAQAHYNLGSVLQDQKKFPEAEAEFREAIRINPDFAQAHNNLGSVLRGLKRLPEAETAFREAIRIKIDYALAHNGLGSALHDQKKLPQAEAEFREAIRIKSDFALAHFNLGNALRDQKRFREAEAEFREAIRIKPDLAEAHNNLGTILNDQKKWSEAEAEYREAIRLKDDYLEARCNLGNVLAHQQKWSAAEDAYHEAIRLKPDFPEAHYNLGNVLAGQKKWPEAATEYREAIRLKPDFPEAHYNLGNVLAGQEKWPEAEAEYREAIRLRPDDPKAHHNLGNVLRARKKFPEAEAEYREAIRLRPGYPEDHCSLGNVLHDQKKLPRAEAEYREAIRLKPDYVEAHCSLGIVLAQQKKFAKALAVFEEAMRLNPTAAADPASFLRYNAACVAVLLAAGHDAEAKELAEPERAQFRSKALGWLRDDLAAWTKVPDRGKRLIAEKMRDWQADPDFATVRDADALAKLPEAERAEWHKLWQDVDALLKRASPPKTPRELP